MFSDCLVDGYVPCGPLRGVVFAASAASSLGKKTVVFSLEKHGLACISFSFALIRTHILGHMECSLAEKKRTLPRILIAIVGCDRRLSYGRSVY